MDLTPPKKGGMMPILKGILSAVQFLILWEPVLKKVYAWITKGKQNVGNPS